MKLITLPPHVRDGAAILLTAEGRSIDLAEMVFSVHPPWHNLLQLEDVQLFVQKANLISSQHTVYTQVFAVRSYWQHLMTSQEYTSMRRSWMDLRLFEACRRQSKDAHTWILSGRIPSLDAR